MLSITLYSPKKLCSHLQYYRDLMIMEEREKKKRDELFMDCCSHSNKFVMDSDSSCINRNRIFIKWLALAAYILNFNYSQWQQFAP